MEFAFRKIQAEFAQADLGTVQGIPGSVKFLKNSNVYCAQKCRTWICGAEEIPPAYSPASRNTSNCWPT